MTSRENDLLENSGFFLSKPLPTEEKREGAGNVYEELARIVLSDVTVIYVSYVNKLSFQRKSVCTRADISLVNIYSFELICKSMSLFECILCSKKIEKDNSSGGG